MRGCWAHWAEVKQWLTPFGGGTFSSSARTAALLVVSNEIGMKEGREDDIPGSLSLEQAHLGCTSRYCHCGSGGGGGGGGGSGARKLT